MGFLEGKRILVTGLSGTRSIAYGIACACKREGATLAFAYQGERLRDRVESIAAELGTSTVLPCDVASDGEIDALFRALGTQWDALDGLVHSIAFAPRESLSGDFLQGLTRAAFRESQEISAYSFPALARAYWFSTNLDAAIHREWELSLGRRNASARVAMLLSELHQRLLLVGLADAHGYELPLTQTDIAECTGLTNVSVNRVLRELREAGAATLAGGRVRILDRSTLWRAAEFDARYLYLGDRSGKPS